MQAYHNIEVRAKWEKKEAKRASQKAKYVQRPRFELVEANSGNALQLQKANITVNNEDQVEETP